MSKIGRYARKPADETRSIVEAYNRGDEVFPDDEPCPAWDADTAVESPKAMSEAPGPHKRSGEYFVHLNDKFQRRLDDERRLAGNVRRRA